MLSKIYYLNTVGRTLCPDLIKIWLTREEHTILSHTHDDPQKLMFKGGIFPSWIFLLRHTHICYFL